MDNLSRSESHSRLHNILIILLGSIFLLATQNSLATPQGGNVVSGNASISQQGNYTEIKQTTDKSIIEWQKFNISKDGHVHFDQPNQNATTLNRIIGGNASSILGQLTATGKIILVNNAGILFGKNARVDVAGLIATTSDITNANFNQNNYQFIQPSGYNSSVINQGEIKVAYQGLVALVAPGVENSGIIQANMGKVVLASGSKFTIDMYGDKLIHFAVDADIAKSSVDQNSNKMAHSIKNSGKIIANGGKVFLTAQAAEDIVDSVINTTGTIEANTISQQGGEIVLLGGKNGTVEISGELLARGNNTNAKGGNITVAAKNIVVGKDSSAVLDVSGQGGGGEILIGRNKNQEDIINAAETYIGTDGKIQANALDLGDGGSVILWANDQLNVHGTIEAKGGVNGGHGGFIETSGNNLFDLTNAQIHASTSNGNAGLWLIDPYDLTIDSTLATTISTALSGGTDYFASADHDINLQHGVTITNTGSGHLTLKSDADANSDGTVNFLGSANIDFSGSSGNVLIRYNPTSFTSPTDYSSYITMGSGVHVSQIHINNATDLQSINLNRTANYSLNADIDVSSISNFDPIGNISNPFLGRLQGNGYVISNLTINRPGQNHVGLFGYSNGYLANFGLQNVNITGNQNVGAVVGENDLNGLIENVYAYGGNVTASGLRAGGFVGANVGGTIINSYAAINANAQGSAAGFASYNNGTINDSYAIGDATASLGNAGGFISENNGTINRSYSTGSASGSTSGGFAAYNYGGTINNSYWDINTSGNISSPGGGTPLTTALTQLQSTFPGWDFGPTPSSATWFIINGETRPILQMEYNHMALQPGSPVIRNAHQLQLMAMNIGPTGNYSLAHDIDLSGTTNAKDIWGASTSSGTGFVPIGPDLSNSFSGSFDGNNHTINNLYINRPGTQYAGLFGVADALIQNVILTNVNVTSDVAVGALVGYNKDSIHNAHIASGNVSGQYIVGGLVGQNDNGTISNSSNASNVLANYAFGGLVGQASGTISNSNNSANIISTDINSSRVAGLVGYSNNALTINNSYNTGNIQGGFHIGGIIGEADTVTGNTYITNTYNTGNITGIHSGSGRVGGLVGLLLNSFIDQSYNEGDVQGLNQVGGLVGWAFGNDTISNSSNHGDITGTNGVGGFVGDSYATITNSYSTGNVIGSLNTGGFIGHNAGSVSNAFWDTQTSGKTNAVGTGSTTGMTGKTTEKMKTKTTFTNAGWDFDNIWGIVENKTYPFLQTLNYIIAGTVYGNTPNSSPSHVSAGINLAFSTPDMTSPLTAVTKSNGEYLLVANKLLMQTPSSNEPLIAYLTTGPHTGNTIYLSDGKSITDLNIYANTVLARKAASLTSTDMSNDVLIAALPSSSAANHILYENPAASTIQTDAATDFYTWTDTPYVLNGDIIANNIVFKNTVATSTNTNLTGSGEIFFEANVNNPYNLTINAPVIIKNGDVTFSGNNFTFNSTIDSESGHNRSLFITGNSDFNGIIGGTQKLNKLETENADIAANINTKGNQTYNGAIILKNDNLSFAADSGGQILFANTLNSKSGNNYGLTLQGNSIFSEIVGGTDRLSSLDVKGTAQIANNIYTSVSQNYEKAVILTGNSILDTSTTGNLTFKDTIDGPYALTLKAQPFGITFNKDIGSITPLNSLTINNALNLGVNVTTSQNQLYYGDIILINNNVLTGNTVHFFAPVNSQSGTNKALQINADALYNFIGNTQALSSYEVQGSSGMWGDVTTTGDQKYHGPATLANDITLTGGSIHFLSTLNSEAGTNRILTTSGNGTTLFNTVGNLQPLAKIYANNAVRMLDDITTTDEQYYYGPVTLDNNITLNGSNLFFYQPVNSATSTNKALTINGNAYLGKVGNNYWLNTFTVNGETGMWDNINTVNQQYYRGPVLLANDINLTGSEAYFYHTINSEPGTNKALTINGNAYLNTVGNNDWLDTFTVNGETGMWGNINTVNQQYYRGLVLLANDINLGGSELFFYHTINSEPGFNRALSIIGDAYLSTIGNNDALASLTAYNNASLWGNINTIGNQDYHGAVNVLENIELNNALGSGNITFYNTLTSLNATSGNLANLSLNSNGDIQFHANVTTGDLTVKNANNVTAGSSGNPIIVSATNFTQNAGTGTTTLGNPTTSNSSYLTTSGTADITTNYLIGQVQAGDLILGLSLTNGAVLYSSNIDGFMDLDNAIAYDALKVRLIDPAAYNRIASYYFNSKDILFGGLRKPTVLP